MDDNLKSFSRAGMAQHLAEKHDLTYQDAREYVNTMLDGAIDKILAGEDVKFTGLATFTTEIREAKYYRNPRTGELLDEKTPPKRVVRVRVSEVLANNLAQIPVEDDELD